MSTADTGGNGVGGGGNGGGGGGGSGGNNGPVVTLVTPSQANAYAAPSLNPRIYGTGFNANTVVEINGAPVPTLPQSSTELWTSINPGTLEAPGVYSMTVSGASPTNALPLTVYSQMQGSEPFTALPGYYTGVQEPPAGGWPSLCMTQKVGAPSFRVRCERVGTMKSEPENV